MLIAACAVTVWVSEVYCREMLKIVIYNAMEVMKDGLWPTASLLVDRLAVGQRV